MRRPVSARPIQCRAINLRQAVKLETVSVHLRASVPRAFHVVGKSRASAISASAIDLGTKCGCSVVPGDTIFEVSHAFKRGVPSTLELACHQPLCWINDLIAARRQRGFVARFLEFPATAAFIMTETKFLLEFEINSLDPPAKFGLIDQTCERDVGGQCGKPVVIRFGFTLRPLDQQPFFSRRLAPPGVVMGRADPPSGKPRG